MTTNGLLCDGPITKIFFEKKMQEFLKTKSKLSTIEGKVISKGLGFTSDVMKVHLTWEPADDNLPDAVIVKAPKIENITAFMEIFGVKDSKDVSAQFAPAVHAAECRAYALLSQHHVVPLPKIYGSCLVEADSPGMLVMEDLADKAGIKDNIADGVTVAQWRNVVEALADLHGWSLTTDVPWRKDFPGFEMMMGMMKQMIDMAPIGLKKVKEKYPEYLGHIDIERIIEEVTLENFQDKVDKNRKAMPEVLTHGDTWVNNMFFFKNADGTLSDKLAALIDWQISLQTAGVFDLSRFATMCVNHEMRRKHDDEIFKHYYDRLKTIAGDKLPTSYQKAKEMYKDANTMNGLFFVAAADMFVTMVAKADEDITGGRKKEILQRIKAGYDDAIAHLEKC